MPRETLMKRPIKLRTAFVTLAVFGLFMTGCASEPGDSENTSTDGSTGSSSETETDTETPAETSSETPAAEPADESEGDGEYAFGTDRDVMATAIESAFSSSNGEAVWDGDTITLKLDKVGDEIGPGFSECMVLDQLLNDEDKMFVEFTDMLIDCAEILP